MYHHTHRSILHSNQRTKNQFRPRNATKGTTSYQLRQYAEATLGGGSLRKIVKLPEGEDENEWLAVNSKKFDCREENISLPRFSGGLLQSYQPSLRIDHRILLPTIMSRDEGHRRVCESVWISAKLINFPHRFEYLWQDSENYKRPTKMPAPTYIEHLMGWVQSNIDNEAVFPSRIGA
jgi:MOB kinase activator 1